MKLKTFITGTMVFTLEIAFLYVLWNYCNENMANTIVTTVLALGSNVVGVYLGFQNNKKANTATKEEGK